MAVSKAFAGFGKFLSEFQGVAVNAVITGGTIAMEEVLNRVMYYCPCVEPDELTGCNSTSNSATSDPTCTLRFNYIYGLLNILVPGIALFFVTLSSMPRVWKLCTGYQNKERQTKLRKEKAAWTLAGILGRSLIAPIVWVCYSLLDGKYYACLSTPLPYDVGPGAIYASCAKVAQVKTPTHSDAYRDNRSHSQFYGWGVIAISVIVGFTAYSVSRCYYPLTYYHAKYYDYYRNHEELEFDQEMNTKAQIEAEKNVLRFMSKFREKALWDRISTVFSFHRNPKNVALYSNLHEFILKEGTTLIDSNNSTADEAESVAL